MADEYAEPVDPREDRTDEGDALTDGGEARSEPRRATWLPWLVLAIAVVVVALLFVRYGQTTGPAADDPAAVLTAARVPDVVGMTKSDALDAIERSGFMAEEDSAFSSEEAPGIVVSQAPAAGTNLSKGAPVIMVVAVDVGDATGAPQGMEADADRVPNVVGMTELRADELLTSAGYRVSISEGYSSSRRRGIIFAQSPEAGEAAGQGTTVEAEMSLGPAPPGMVQVPNVLGDSVKSASRKLERAGFDARSMLQYHPEYSGAVFQQNPAAGTLAPEGSRVFILSGD